MKETAAGLAALGRGGDSMLVHMTPGEVSGLQALAMSQGTSLTINPHTGLPEAFSLKSLLPTIAGVALAPFMGPLAAGLVIGGAHGLATGFENPLQSVMAGLGGAGGAGIGGALGAAGGAAGSAGAALPAEGALGSGLSNLGTSTSASQIPSQMLADQATSNFLTSGMPQGLPMSTDALSAASGYGSGVGSLQPLEMGLSSSPVVPPPTTYSSMSKGLSSMLDSGGGAARDAFMRKAGGVEGLAKTGAMAFAPAASEAMVPPRFGGTEPVSTIRPYEFQRSLTPGAFDDVTDSRERRYFEDRYVAKEPYQLARGGLAAFAAGGRAKKPNPLEQRYEMADLRDSQAMQKKAMGMYQYAVGGKAVSGPGDGMSDDVKANINGVREARLSDGEFVIPADVVSGLGNGSTDAGSKQLRAMMDRVRQKRTGRKQQAPQIKVKGLMPA